MQWRDRDGDGWGDRPDTNRTDRFPNITSQWNDTDLDGFGDQPAPAFQPDACPSVQGASSHDRFGCPDGDGDGWSDPDASLQRIPMVRVMHSLRIPHNGMTLMVTGTGTIIRRNSA